MNDSTITTTPDNIIGDIDGNSEITFDWVEINGPKHNSTEVSVTGHYGDETVTLKTTWEFIELAGMDIRAMWDGFQLEPADEDGWIRVKTDGETLVIIPEEPDSVE